MIVSPTPEAILAAGEAIRRGELVGMPTETVYGIAADAFNEQAIRQTFALKGRPADNPLIVHLAKAEDWTLVATSFPMSARRLVAAFWPGPLTVVLPKRAEVPYAATGELETVAVRVPGHAVARGLIEAAGVPVTAPSANLFMSLSPSRAQDISSEIEEGLAVILDGGPCEVGIESTVVDFSDAEPTLLRPGGLARREIELALGRPLLLAEGAKRKSPGQYPRHYAPRTPIRLVERLDESAAGLTFSIPLNRSQVKMPLDPVAFAARLYQELHALDRLGLSEIAVESLPDGDEWEAVRDRLIRAMSAE